MQRVPTVCNTGMSVRLTEIESDNIPLLGEHATLYTVCRCFKQMLSSRWQTTQYAECSADLC